MKYFIFIFLTCNVFFLKIRSETIDTIDYWEVYLNNKKIHSYTMYDKHDIILKTIALSDKDSITVRYATDTPCDECLFYLEVENEKRTILTVEAKGEYNPLTFSLKDLIEYKNKNRFFDVFYFQEKIKNTVSKTPIFRIQLE